MIAIIFFCFSSGSRFWFISIICNDDVARNRISNCKIAWTKSQSIEIVENRQLSTTQFNCERCNKQWIDVRVFFSDLKNSTCFCYVFLIRNEADSVFVLWKISYLWYTMIGMLIVLILGTIVSFLSGPQNPQKLDPKLLCKFSNCFRSSKVNTCSVIIAVYIISFVVRIMNNDLFSISRRPESCLRTPKLMTLN